MSLFSKMKSIGKNLFVEPLKKTYEVTMEDPLSAISQVAGTLLSMNSADKATKRQIAWERERAQNAHQWEVQDLIKAGLNPILSAGGSGAVTGGISAPMPDVSGIQNSATEVKRLKNETMLANSEVDKSNSQTNLNKVNAELGELQKALTEAQTSVTANQVKKSKAEAELAQKQLDAMGPLLETDKAYNESTMGQNLHYINRGWGDIGAPLTLGIGGLGLGALKYFGAKSSAKAVAKATESKEFKNEIMKGTDFPYNKLVFRNHYD